MMVRDDQAVRFLRSQRCSKSVAGSWPDLIWTEKFPPKIELPQQRDRQSSCICDLLPPTISGQHFGIAQLCQRKAGSIAERNARFAR